MKEVNARSEGTYTPGPVMLSMKAVEFPSIQNEMVKIKANGELDVPYYLYNFRIYNSSSNCPPGEICDECESDGGVDCQRYEGWQVVGKLNGRKLQMLGS